MGVAAEGHAAGVAGAAGPVEGGWALETPAVEGSSLHVYTVVVPVAPRPGMQRLVMEHWNWLGAQVTSAVGLGERVRVGPPPLPQLLSLPALALSWSCQQFLAGRAVCISNLGDFVFGICTSL